MGHFQNILITKSNITSGRIRRGAKADNPAKMFKTLAGTGNPRKTHSNGSRKCPRAIRAPKDVAFPRAFISRNWGSAKSDIPLPTM